MTNERWNSLVEALVRIGWVSHSPEAVAGSSGEVFVRGAVDTNVRRREDQWSLLRKIENVMELTDVGFGCDYARSAVTDCRVMVACIDDEPMDATTYDWDAHRFRQPTIFGLFGEAHSGRTEDVFLDVAERFRKMRYFPLYGGPGDAHDFSSFKTSELSSTSLRDVVRHDEFVISRTIPPRFWTLYSSRPSGPRYQVRFVVDEYEKLRQRRAIEGLRDLCTTGDFDFAYVHIRTIYELMHAVPYGEPGRGFDVVQFLRESFIPWGFFVGPCVVQAFGVERIESLPAHVERLGPERYWVQLTDTIDDCVFRPNRVESAQRAVAEALGTHADARLREELLGLPPGWAPRWLVDRASLPAPEAPSTGLYTDLVATGVRLPNIAVAKQLASKARSAFDLLSDFSFGRKVPWVRIVDVSSDDYFIFRDLLALASASWEDNKGQVSLRDVESEDMSHVTVEFRDSGQGAEAVATFELIPGVVSRLLEWLNTLAESRKLSRFYWTNLEKRFRLVFLLDSEVAPRLERFAQRKLHPISSESPLPI